MDRTRQRTAIIFTTIFMVVMLLACNSMYANEPQSTLPTPRYAIPITGGLETPNPAYTFAQATIDAGRGQLSDLSRQATEANLNVAQTANAAALSVQDYNQRQKLALDSQAAAIRQNIAQAAATQNFLKQQTEMAQDTAEAAQKSTATAVYSTYLMNVTQTAQAQTILSIQGSQTAQALVALTAYPMTATPFAATQAALISEENSREQRAFINRIVNPLIPIVAIIDFLLLILGIVLIYQYYVSEQQPASPTNIPVNDNFNSWIPITGGTEDDEAEFDRTIPFEFRPPYPSGLTGENTANLEIVDPDEPLMEDWIDEADEQMDSDGGP
jgi:hypothetical protein